MKHMFGKKKEIDPAKKESKLGVLKDLKSTMSSMMGEGLKGKMMEAKVSAKNPEDLKDGLEKAKDIVSELPEEKDERPEMSMDQAEDEAYDENEMLDQCDTPEEIDEMIQRLQEKKQELMKG